MVFAAQSSLQVESASPTTTSGLLENLEWMQRLALALVFGCILGLSSPGIDCWWLAWIGLAPLMVLVASCKRKSEAALTGLSFGLAYHCVCLRWFLGLYPLNWMGMADWLSFQSAAFVWLLESLHQALLISAFALLLYVLPMRASFLPHYQRPYFPYLLSVPLVWIFLQWVVGTSEFFLGTPVNQLSYSQWQQIELIQIAKLGGSQLIEFLMLLSNAALATLLLELSGWGPTLQERLDRLSAREGAIIDLSAIALLIAFCSAWGHFEVGRVAAETNVCRPAEGNFLQQPAVPLAIVQANVSIEDERLGAFSPAEICQRYLSISRGLGVPLEVFPEGIVNALQTKPELLLSQLTDISRREKKEIVTGATTNTTRGSFNTAMLLSPLPYKDNVYAKRRLVPFGEFLPAGPIGEFIPPSIKRLLMGGSDGFLPDSSLRLLSCLWGKIGTSICVEVVYPKLISAEVRRGASLLVNVSNLAWFHNSVLNRQILACAIMRAVENGRYMVLSTNTGISAIIDPAGVVTSCSLPGRKGILLDTVQFLFKKTPFTQMWWL